MMLLSVIVPVYNVQDYLMECVNTILCQSFADLELLLIDDGSTDESGQLCDEYARIDSRVKVFHKENGGLSSARNFGLDKCRGKYVTFVDSDDYLVGDYYSEAIDALENNDCLDMVRLQYAKVYEDGRIEKHFNTSSSLCDKTKSDDYIRTFCSQEAFAGIKVYRTSVFNDIRYPEGQILEDLYVVPVLYCKINKWAIIMVDGYYAYRQRASSICHTPHTPKMLEDIALAYAGILKLYQANDRKNFLRCLATYSSGYLNTLVLFPSCRNDYLKQLYAGFRFSFAEAVTAHVSLSQKIKLLLLKLMGYKGLSHIYKLIYRLKH